METRSNHVLVGAVVLILLAVLALFIVWLARVGGEGKKDYDIFFSQSVDGLTKGSVVAYSGVPLGEVKQIKLWKPDPDKVLVRISINEDTPILKGTFASASCSFTGTCTVQLDGAVKGAAPIVCPSEDPSPTCPDGIPVIPQKAGGIGALLASAPQLLERVSTLTEKLTDLLSEKNQASIAGILANTNRLTSALADRGPEIAATLAETRITLQKAGVAAQQIGQLADTTNGLLANDVGPAAARLNVAVGSAQKSFDSLNALMNDARPGVQAFSKQTIPEVGALVRDLRVMSESLSSVAEKIDRGGAGSLVGSQRLPEYKGK